MTSDPVQTNDESEESNNSFFLQKGDNNVYV